MYISLLKISLKFVVSIFFKTALCSTRNKEDQVSLFFKRRILKFSPPFTFTVKFELLFLSLGIMF